jgi:hypothetical protein
LTTTIHDAGDVALDASTQALVAVLLVQVSRPVSVAYGLVGEVSAAAGGTLTLRLRVANDGALPWSEPPQTVTPWGGSIIHEQPTINVRWLSLDDSDDTAGPTLTIAGPALAPGEETIVPLALRAPSEAGWYLLLIDLVSPLHGSMAAAGCPVAEARVLVQPVDPVLRHRQGG